MPLFTYLCRTCEQKSEILVRGSEAPACPACGSSELEKQASAFAPVAGGSSAPAEPACSSCAQAGGCPFN